MVGTGVESADRLVGDMLPSFALMAVGTTDLNGQASVEQHDPALRPWGQIAVGRCGNAQIVAEFLVDINQAFRQRPDIRGDAEAQSHRVTGRRIRILSDNQHFDAVEGDGERAQDIASRWKIMASRRDFGPQKIPHPMDIRFHVGQRCGPSGVNNLGQRFDMSMFHAYYSRALMDVLR